MKTQKRKRVDRIEKAIAAQPLRQDVVQKAFEHFCETGELPEEQRLADAVARQALRGGEPEDPSGASSDVTGEIFKILVVAEQRSRGEEPEPELPSVRECLLDEAVFGPEFIRHGARVALRLFVGFLEGDPTDPSFLADKTLPEHPGVGLHLLGYPERLGTRPYVRQARRLWARCDEIRERIDHDDESWGEAADEARDAFYERGDLPDDDLMCEVLLADAEVNALIAHKHWRRRVRADGCAGSGGEGRGRRADEGAGERAGPRAKGSVPVRGRVAVPLRATEDAGLGPTAGVLFKVPAYVPVSDHHGRDRHPPSPARHRRGAAGLHPALPTRGRTPRQAFTTTLCRAICSRC